MRDLFNHMHIYLLCLNFKDFTDIKRDELAWHGIKIVKSEEISWGASLDIDCMQIFIFIQYFLQYILLIPSSTIFHFILFYFLCFFSSNSSCSFSFFLFIKLYMDLSCYTHF